MKRVLILTASVALLIGTIILSQSAVKNPHGNLKWDCQDCHTTDSWSEMRDSLLFDHAATGFVLVGAHAAADCIGCHKSPVFSNVAVACVDCHADQHKGELGTDCQGCHTPRDWANRRSTLELHATKGFALTGVHAVADCEACHVGHAEQEYAGAPVECYDCHAEDYAATDQPNHAQSAFPLDCVACHRATAASWLDADFNHPASFPLTGGHGNVACQACHASGYTATPTECYSCHDADYASTTDPNHQASGFTTDCTLCHTIAGWQPAHYDHSATAFPLTGAHLQVNCVACHATQYAGTPTNCFACHQTDFEQTSDPNHQLAGFGQDCTTCHTTSAWDPSLFDHSAATGYALTGAHLTASCVSCHATGFSGTPSDCYSCHQSDFEGVTEPNHVQQGFDHDCMTCHTTSAWSPSSFDHAATAFPLTGKHLEVSCTSCHASGYAGTPTDCYSCHQTSFESASDPNHVQAGFGHDCTACHTTSAWAPSSFNHSAATGFALTGAHLTASCVSCHATGYSGTATDCYSCHQTDFEGVTDPNHVLAGFSHDCTTCHSTSAWSPSTFDHSTTAFPLTGAHLTATCIACHAGGFTGTPANCFACHQADYEGTTNPSHSAAGFPVECQSCHTTTAWTPSSWDHDGQYFPIYSGTHAGKWDACADCHVNPASFVTFECINCHEHNKTDMDAKHVEEQDYEYVSTACYTCHPRGTH